MKATFAQLVADVMSALRVFHRDDVRRPPRGGAHRTVREPEAGGKRQRVAREALRRGLGQR